MTNFVLIHRLILLWLIFVCAVPTCQGETFYVKPTPETECPGSQCETLQYYLDHLNEIPNLTIFNQDITVKFLNGTHRVDSIYVFDVINIQWSSIMIAGPENEDAIIIVDQNQCSNRLHNMSGLVFFLQSTTFRVQHISLQGTLPIVFSDDNNSYAPSFLQLKSVSMYLLSIHALVQEALIENLFLNESVIWSIDTGTIDFINCTFSYQSMVYILGTTHVTFINCKFSEINLVVMDSKVILYGTNTFANASSSAVKCYRAEFVVTGTALFTNNTGTRGAALALYSSTLCIAQNANMSFTNNLAIDRGGALYIEPSVSPFMLAMSLANGLYQPSCFYKLLHFNDQVNISYNVHFFNNSAYFGGDDIYGSSFNSPHCKNSEEYSVVTVTGASSNISSVSSDPTRVCLCDSTGQPQCGVNYTHRQVSPGETFTLSVVLVGENFGTTSGQVVAYFINADKIIQTFQPGNRVPINSKYCTDIGYSMFSQYQNGQETMYLASVYSDPKITVFYKVEDPALISVRVDLTIVPCPPGFQLVRYPTTCDCYHTLCDTDVLCNISDGNGLFSSNGSLWIGYSTTENKTTCNQYCDVNYCNLTGDWIDILHDPDSQCAYNRAGRLCGSCKTNYSLAIGTNRCIHCPNNNNVSLIIFFALAGLVLVFFVTAVNLTVTQHVVNGLIFYANIIWIYQNIFFPQGKEMSGVMVFLKTFIAWVNLDFGIEVCFIKGLTAFWKLLLQFVFPFYIWCIVWFIIVTAKHSTRFTRLLPSKRTIPVLATVYLLSYMKLVSITNSALKFSFISEYAHSTNTTRAPKPSVVTVWSLDGNLVYCGYPHIFLFLAGLATLVILWIPYTVPLFLMQWLRRFSHWRLLKWTQQYFPITDAYFAPLKHQHQYWFGVLLLTRGILLVISTSSFGIPYSINVLILLIFAVLLLFYMNLMQVYESTGVLILSSSFFVNIIALSGYFILTYTREAWKGSETMAVGLSAGVALLQLCGIVVYSIIKECKPICDKCCALTHNADDYQALEECDAIAN